MKHFTWPQLALTTVMGLCSTAAHAQIPDFLRILVPPVGAASAADSGSRQSATADSPARRLKDIRSEMAPDTTCSRARERFNVGEKLLEYGGIEAGLRLERLIASDYRYSDLKPGDKEMLEYLAHTTVWVPPEAETRIAAIYDSSRSILGSNEGAPNEGEQLALNDIDQRLERIRNSVPDYPSEIRLKLDKKLADGAFARFGGVIQLSESFLNGLSDAGIGADFLLAHEVSHVYKRHAIKEVQFKLISSSEGWELAKQVLKRAQRGAQIDPFGDAYFLFTTVPRLIEFVRGVQLRFGQYQELEADACSTVWLKAVGTEPSAAFSRYKAAMKPESTYGPLHPTTEEREARFAEKAEGRVSKKAPPKIDKGTVRKGGTEVIRKQPPR